MSCPKLKKLSYFIKYFASTILLTLYANAGLAEVKIGLVSSATGPGAAMGIPYKNTLALLPEKVANETVRYFFINDESDPTQGVKAVQRLINEEKVDAVIGSNSMPISIAIAEITTSAKIPFIAVSPIKLNSKTFHWSFAVPQQMDLMIKGIIEDIKNINGKTIGYIGFSDAWGDAVLDSLKSQVGKEGFSITSDERFARTDTSVKAQAIKVNSTKPDVILIGASSSAAVLPQVALRDIGFKGRIYQTHGAVTLDFIRLGGKTVEGAIAPTGPLMVTMALDDSNTIKAKAIELKRSYEDKYGSGTFNPFVGYVWDAGQLLVSAIPTALKKSTPGTLEFRTALREAIENVHELVGTQGIYSMSSTIENYYNG